MKKHWGLLFMLVLFVAGSLLPGCKSTETSTYEPAAAPQPAKPAPQPAPAQSSGSGPWLASRTYPPDSGVRLDLLMPNEVPVNASFDHTIKVTNVTDTTVSDVVVTERVPQNFKLQNSQPAPDKAGANLVWALGSLDSKATREIKVSGVATTVETLRPCATVTFVTPVCANIAVVEPKLLLVKAAPKEVLLCDPIPVQFVVRNNGTGAVQGVKIVDTLPAGLKTADGKGEMVLDVGTLAAGQAKQFTGTLKASKTGEYVNKAVASSSSGLKTEATTTTIVRQPILAITKTGTTRQYVGRPATYEITVTNRGDAPAANTIVEDMLPQDAKDVQSLPPGTMSGRKMVWQLGTLAVNASKKISLTYIPTGPTAQTNTATASAVCAEPVTATAKTTLYGIAAVLLEVIDTDDPVQVGSRTTYIITATNQGSSPSTNVQITAVAEDSQEIVSANGPTPVTVATGTATFAPLPSLAVKAKATWQVVVKALKPGDVRFTVMMRTAELGRPVQETEATQQYELEK